MLILNIILITTVLYLIFYAIYSITLNIKAYSANEYLDDVKTVLRGKNKLNKLCVLIFAGANDKKLYDLLKVLSFQNYPKDFYEVHVIYKKDSEIEPMPQGGYDAKIHIIENPDYFSKDKALSIFIDKTIKDNDFDAFVFLGPDRIIDEHYLYSVNLHVEPSTVTTGELSVISSTNNFTSQFKAQILKAYIKCQNKIQNLARTMFEMATIIDGSNCVIASDILQKVGKVCFETKNDALKFSLFLASNSIKPVYTPFIRTKVDINDYDASNPSIWQKLNMFKYYLPIIFSKPRAFKEFVFYTLKPDVTGIFVAYFFAFYCSLKFYSFFELKFVFHIGVLLAINFLIGVFASKLNLRELIYLLMYPAFIVWQRVKIFTKKISLIWIENRIYEDENTNSATVNTLVFDGKSDQLCKLFLVSEDGMRKVVFELNKKQISSDSCIRMCDAMTSLSGKLKLKGFTLKICQNCANFNSSVDGSLDLLKGECQAAAEVGQNSQTLIWNTCRNFK